MFTLETYAWGEALTLRYPDYTGVLIVVSALVVGGAGMFVPAKEGQSRAMRRLGAIAATLFLLAMGASVLTFRIVVDRSGIRTREYVLRSKSIAWDEVREVTYAHSTHLSRRGTRHNEYFYVNGDGGRLRLVIQDLPARGFDELLGRIVAWAPRSALGGDPDAFAALVQDRPLTK